jgi:hypothetical protein
LLKTFYPQAKVGQIYLFVQKDGEKGLREQDKAFLKVAPESYKVTDEKSLGFYSATPYGVIDLIAFDAKNLSDYDFIFLTGWNTCSKEQLVSLCDFMDKGGKVMLCKAHLSDSVSREEVLTGKAKTMDDEIVDKFLSYKDNLIYFDRDGFPKEFEEEYALALKQAGEQYGCKFIKDVDHLCFTEYENQNGSRNIYAFNIRWWNNEGASATLKLKDNSYGLEFNDNDLKLLAISPDGKKAVLVQDYALDVSEITDDKAVIKGFSSATVKVFSNGVIKDMPLEVDGQCIIEF